MTIQLLNDRYQIINTLGAGGFGETYLAEDTYMPSKRRCVVKLLRPIQNNPQIYQLVQERFQREAAILEELGSGSDQIPKLYAYFEATGQFYLVQEWVEGQTLTAKVQQHGLFNESAIQEILVNVLPVLDYVHSRQIIHRDIKPDNIMVRHRDGKPVLIDFGAVRESMGTVVNSQGLPTSSIVIGTPGYMPSEQAAGRPMYSSDLYSLGVTAIYLLTGRQPQHLETDSQTGEILWRQYTSHLSPRIAEVIDRAIAYHPRDRYPTARAMLDALQEVTNPIPPTQPIIPKPQPPTIPVTPRPTQSNHPNGLLMGGLIAGGLVGAAIIVTQVFPKSSQPIAEQNVTSSITPSNNTSTVVETPTPSPSQVAPIYQPTPLAQVSESPKFTPAPSPLQVAPSSQPTPLAQVSESPEFTPPPSTNSTLPDIVKTPENYFWLSRRPVTDTDLDGKDGLTLDIMRNSIFARHGRRFDTPGLQEYFDNQPWYVPTYSPKEFPPKLLSKLEQRNIDYIAKYQDRYQLRYFKK